MQHDDRRRPSDEPLAALTTASASRALGSDLARGNDAAATPAHPEETSSIGHHPRVRQAANAPAAAPVGEAGEAPRRARVHLVIGPVGAGKSTFALGLVRRHAALRLTLDEWMTALFSPDRPETGLREWYVERAARCIEQIWKVARASLQLGTDVVLEIGLLRREERERFYERAGAAGVDLSIYVLDAARDVRRARVLERNQTRGATFSMVVPPAIFELASDLWEPPEPGECQGRDVRFVRTDMSRYNGENG